MPSGIISLRVAPDDLKRLLGSFEKLGKIVQHATERQDKTTVVVDTEAKIKNLTSFRDNLRAMLSKSAATVKDLVEIQKQLTDTQSELDSETAQRKILANETEKIAAEISLRVERPSGNAGGALPISGMPCVNQVPFWRIVLRLLSPQLSLSFRGGNMAATNQFEYLRTGLTAAPACRRVAENSARTAGFPGSW